MIPEKYKKPIKYIFAGGLATFVNLAVLFICVEYFHFWYLTGAVVAFIFGVMTSYTLQKFWTFKDVERGNMHIQFFWFTIFALAMLGLNTLLMYVLVDIFLIWYLLAQAISSLCIALINYNVFNKLIFKSNVIQPQ